MAIVKCHECKADVSTEAKTCLKCGAKVRKPTSRATWLVGGLLGVSIIAGLATSQRQQEDATAVEATKSPQQRASEAAARDAENAAYSRAVVVANALRKGLKNPKSWELNSTLLTVKGALCFEYHGTNGFGGIVPGFAVVSPDGKATVAGSESDVANLWNKHCAQQPGKEISRTVGRLMD